MMAEEKKQKYPEMSLSKQGTLIIPDYIFTQINYLHNRVGTKEWSGILLYEVIKGSPAKPEDFVLKARYIYLMDIGTGAYTEYETDGDIVDMYDNIEGAMDMKVGHIHTHHSMDAFFSGTDTDELHENVDKHNYYLSLIVNFSAEYKAKVAFLSDVHTHSKMSYITDKGNKSHFKTDTIGKTMITINMSIVYEYNDKFFYDRYAEVLKKEKPAPKYNQYNWKDKWNDEHPAIPERTGVPVDSDPKDMKDYEVERLAKNVLSLSPDLKETRSCYQILYRLANSKQEEIGIYYHYLTENIEEVISSFFDQELEPDEMTIVVKELRSSLMRFYNHVSLKQIIDNIDLIFEEFGAQYASMKKDEELDDILDEEKNSLESELLEIEGGM